MRFSLSHFPNIEFSQVAIIGTSSGPEQSDVVASTSWKSRISCRTLCFSNPSKCCSCARAICGLSDVEIFTWVIIPFFDLTKTRACIDTPLVSTRNIHTILTDGGHHSGNGGAFPSLSCGGWLDSVNSGVSPYVHSGDCRMITSQQSIDRRDKPLITDLDFLNFGFYLIHHPMV